MSGIVPPTSRCHSWKASPVSQARLFYHSRPDIIGALERLDPVARRLLVKACQQRPMAVIRDPRSTSSRNVIDYPRAHYQ